MKSWVNGFAAEEDNRHLIAIFIHIGCSNGIIQGEKTRYSLLDGCQASTDTEQGDYYQIGLLV